jgi:hypothetical protein
MSQRERIVRYLFGQQTAEEGEQTEQDYFADAAFLNEVQTLCDELIDDYLHERMPPPERTAFAQRLHALPFLRERLATERALLRWAKSAPPVLPQRRWAVAAALKSQLTAAWRLPGVAALLALCVLGAGIWYAVRRTSSDATLPRPLAAPVAVTAPLPIMTPAERLSPDVLRPSERPGLTEKHATLVAPVLASLLLSADSVRGGAELPTLSLPKGRGMVRLQLEVPPAPPQPYRAILRAPHPLKTWPRLLPQRYQTDWIVTLRLPAELLQAKEYVIELQGATTTIYRFRVQPK